MKARFLYCILLAFVASVCDGKSGAIDANLGVGAGIFTGTEVSRVDPTGSLRDQSRFFFGKEQKFRILVDKVMQPEEGWVTKEWMVKEAAAAGFNVFVPRIGHDRFDEILRVVGWCKKYGIYMMPWMRGTLAAPDGSAAAGKRLVWADGTEQLIYSPSSDELWAWMSQHILEYAKIAADDPTLLGVFLDYENYSPNNQKGNAYPLSYDMGSLKRFAKIQDLKLPIIPLSDRKKYLEEKRLHEAFTDFSVAHWRQRARTLSLAVDKYDKRFRFVVYPAPGTPFIQEAIYQEWASNNVPLVLAGYLTYGRLFGRPGGDRIFHSEALLDNRKTLMRLAKVPQRADISHFYIGGIDPAVVGADPEFCAKNAVMISEISDGYWVFYEGPEYGAVHQDYFKWFSWANKAIVEKDYVKQREPRVDPEPWLERLVGDDGKSIIAPPPSEAPFIYPRVKIRQKGVFVVAGQKGRAVTVEVAHHSVGSHKCSLTWNATSLVGDGLAAGVIAQDRSGAISVIPKTDGLFLLRINVNLCAFSIAKSNTPLAAYTTPNGNVRDNGLFLYQGPVQLYFGVPKGIERLSFKASGEGSETVQVKLLDEQGRVLDRAETTADQTGVELKANTKDAAGQTWSVVAEKASQGIFEDYKLTPGPMLPPVLNFDSHIFSIKN